MPQVGISRTEQACNKTINRVESFHDLILNKVAELFSHYQQKLGKTDRIFFEFKNSLRVQLTAKIHGFFFFFSKFWLHMLFAVTEWFCFEFFCFHSNTSNAAFIPCVVSSYVQDLKSVSAKKKQQGFPSFTNLMCTNTHLTKDLSVAPLSSTVISLTFCVHF